MKNAKRKIADFFLAFICSTAVLIFLLKKSNHLESNNKEISSMYEHMWKWKSLNSVFNNLKDQKDYFYLQIDHITKLNNNGATNKRILKHIENFITEFNDRSE